MEEGGVPIGVVIKPQLKHATQYLGLPNSVLGYDAPGRAIPANALDLNGMGSGYRFGKAGSGLCIRPE